MIVNIYLTIEQKQKLSTLCRKYELSISTIATYVLFYLTKYLKQMNVDYNLLLESKYIYNEKRQKTSIKVRNEEKNVCQTLYKNKSKAYTNALAIYLKKDIDKYIENKQGFYNDLNKELQIQKDVNWDYNHFIRTMNRYEKIK